MLSMEPLSHGIYSMTPSNLKTFVSEVCLIYFSGLTLWFKQSSSLIYNKIHHFCAPLLTYVISNFATAVQCGPFSTWKYKKHPDLDIVIKAGLMLNAVHNRMNDID
jgi:hypothetical protein